jgi:hypothetical protein
MIEYTASINGLDQLQRHLEQAPGMVLAETARAVNRSLTTYQQTARDLAPVDSSRLRNSILVTPAKIEGTKVTGAVTASAPYSAAVEGGTGLYGPNKARIRPKHKRALAFTVGGKKVVVTSTKGMKGRFYMKGSLDRHQKDTDAYFAQAAENVARAITDGGSA